MKLYCFYTSSHKKLYKDWLQPTASKEYLVVPNEFPQITKGGVYSESGWPETQYQKVLFWIKAIESSLGDIIVCSDVDVQFFGPTKKILIELLGDKDICFQKNDSNQTACSGFFVCRCSRNLIDFFQIIANRLKRKFNSRSSGEQVEINNLLSEKWYNSLSWSLLPSNKFWNNGEPYKSIDELRIPKYLLMHHANWCSGLDSKIEQLEHVSFHRSKNLDFWKPIKFNLLTQQKKSPRIALCLSSLLRSFEISSISLIVRVIKSLPCKPDLIGHFPEKCKSINHNKIINNIKPFCNQVNIIFEKDPVLPDEELVMDINMADQPNGIRGNLLQWVSMQNCAKMLDDQENSLGYKYDWVIWCRPDIYFFNSLDNLLMLNKESLYLPCHDNHLGGRNDRFCLGSSDLVKQRMHIYDYFTKEWYPNNHNDIKHLTWSKYKNQYIWNPELILKDYLNKLNINVLNLNLCFGKLRDNFFATAPFWHEIHGNPNNTEFGEYDIINHGILNRLNQFDKFELIKGSNWHAVNVLEDSSLLYDYNQTKPIESKMHNPAQIKLSFLDRLVKKFTTKMHE